MVGERAEVFVRGVTIGEAVAWSMVCFPLAERVAEGVAL